MDSLLVLVILTTLVTLSQGSIRCYCNSPECVATNYICTSALGKCFSQFGYSTSGGGGGGEEQQASAVGAASSSQEQLSSHGCVEELGEEDVCQAQGDLIKARSPPSPWPVLMCCTEEMCNYIDSLDVDIFVNTDNQTTREVASPSERQLSPQDLWFKAAVIAVPIAGVFILILLVLLAVRMLRADTRLQSHTLAKTHLYIPEYTDTAHLPYGPPHPHHQFYHPAYGQHYIGGCESYSEGKGGGISCGGGGGGGGGGGREGCRGGVEELPGDYLTYERISDCGSDISTGQIGPHSSLIVEEKHHGPGTIV